MSKSKPVCISVTPDVLAEMKEAAKKRRLTLSGYVRELHMNEMVSPRIVCYEADTAKDTAE